MIQLILIHYKNQKTSVLGTRPYKNNHYKIEWQDMVNERYSNYRREDFFVQMWENNNLTAEFRLFRPENYTHYKIQSIYKPQ